MDATWLELNRMMAEMDSLEMPLPDGGVVQHIPTATMLLHYQAKGLVNDN